MSRLSITLLITVYSGIRLLLVGEGRYHKVLLRRLFLFPFLAFTSAAGHLRIRNRGILRPIFILTPSRHQKSWRVTFNSSVAGRA